MREPCERLVSAYHHLRKALAVTYGNTHCRYTPQRCATHWIHHVRTVDDIVGALAERWQEILAYPLSRSRRTGAWARGFSKHEVVLLPQSLWIGNFSVVTCTPSIDGSTAALARLLRCARTPNASARVEIARAPGHASDRMM